MSPWRRWSATAAIASLCALAIAACDGPSEAIEADQDGTAELAGPLAARPTPDPNAVIWALAEAPVTLDPARAAIDPGGLQVSAQVYDRLFTLQRERPFQRGAGVAEDWDVDASGRTYTFTIRQGLTFHDGTPLDAPAVKWNFERWMLPSHPAHHGDFRAWRSMFGGPAVEPGSGVGDGAAGQSGAGAGTEAEAGAEAAAGMTPNLVQRVEALDRHTLRITLNAPFAPFLNHLAMPPFGLASPAAVQAQGERYGSDAAHLPVGSGPFRVVDWDPEAGIVQLAAFPGHHAGPPAGPGLRFVTVPDAAERLAAVEGGLAHAAELAASDTISLTLQLGPNVRAIPRPARANAWLMLDHERPPLGDAAVRHAFALAIDRAALARQHFGAAALPSDQLLVPEMPGFEPELETRAQDVEAARQLLADAGVGDGFTLNIAVPTTPRPYLPDPVGTGRAVAEMLSAIGIQAAAQTDTLRRFLTRRATGRTTAWIIGWELQSPDPDNAWYYHFGPSRMSSEGRYDNRLLFDRLLEGQRTVSSDTRTAAYRDAATMVRQDDPRIFLAAARSIVVASDRLAGFAPGAMGFDDLATVHLVESQGADVAPTPAPDADLIDARGAGADAPADTQGDPVPAPGTATPTAEGEQGADGASGESQPEGVQTAAPLATETRAAP